MRRLVVVEQVYYQGEVGVGNEARFSRENLADEQVWQRTFIANAEWKPLQCGWLAEGASMLSLTNDEGKGLQKRPTPEERVALAARVVELRCCDGHVFARLRPGESLRFEPTDVSRLQVRCATSAKCTLTLYPPEAC